jgi:predicted dehydrogenase
MRVGLIGTGAVADKHAQAYRNLGFELAVCWNRTRANAEAFAERWRCRIADGWEDVCHGSELDFIDACTYPNFRVPIVEQCEAIHRPVLIEKPIAVTAEDAERIRDARTLVGVISQKRFDDSVAFLKRALNAGRLGRLLEADAYVKWFRSDEYYARPGKGTWTMEGGGALMNQAIHQVDLLRYLAGEVTDVQGQWRLGARHNIESEDIVQALLEYENGACGVLQASTALWPGQTERIELHGTKGTAILSGDRLTAWDVLDDAEANAGDPAPVQSDVASGASDPMAIRSLGFERQILDFAAAIRNNAKPLVSAEEGYRSFALVEAIYKACRKRRLVQ